MESNLPPSPPPAPPGGGAPPSVGGPEAENLRNRVIEALRCVFDPEIPVNIYDIGLVYGIDVSDEGAVRIRMTLTSPSCPAAEAIPLEVEERVKTLAGVTATKVEIVWDPPWTPEKMSEAAKLQLGFF